MNPKTPKTIQIFNPETNAVEEVEPVVKSDAEWKQLLTPEQYEVMRRHGTERPFSNQCAIPHGGEGIYRCAACGTALFAYGKKFESGTGWPSFWEPISSLNLTIHKDVSVGMVREEVRCVRCASHLGHVFDDPSTRTTAYGRGLARDSAPRAEPVGLHGPLPTGKRYCINAVVLTLDAEP